MPSSQARSIRGSNGQRDLELFEDKSHRMRPRIIGGGDAREGRYSYTVSLQDYKGHFCGGSLIARDVVLTAAHCAGGQYDVVINRHNLGKSNGETISMSKEVKHDDYNNWTTENDFMLVILSRPTNEDVALVNLNSNKGTPSPGDEVFVMGWGDTEAADDVQRLSDTLQDVSVNAISNQDCEDSKGTVGGWFDSYNGQIKDSMLCATDFKQDACQGDSGGPLVILGNDSSGADDVQVGVVSWGIGCATKEFPGVYSRVSSAYDWIEKEVCKRSQDPPSWCGGGSNPAPSQPSQPSQPSKPNNPPSPSPPSPSPPSPSQPSGNSGWQRLIDTDFKSGLGASDFNDGGQDAKYHSSVKGRNGVVRIQDGKGKRSSVYSDTMDLNDNYKKFRVTFSFYLLGMESDDEFCLEYSTDDGNKYNQVVCLSSRDYYSKAWQDDESFDFQANGANNLRIRFICKGNSRKDDVLISDVKLEGLV